MPEQDNPFKITIPPEEKPEQTADDVPQWPIPGASKFSGEFGAGDARHQMGKSQEELEKYHGHKGTDVVGAKGAPAYPMMSGIVSKVIQDPKTWKKDGDPGSQGNMVSIDHPKYGLVTKYLHLESISVSQGQEVTKTTPIGTCGNTGSASVTGPHIHFEVWKGSEAINARPLIDGKKQLTPKVATTRNVRMKTFHALAQRVADRLWEDED